MFIGFSGSSHSALQYITQAVWPAASPLIMRLCKFKRCAAYVRDSPYPTHQTGPVLQSPYSDRFPQLLHPEAVSTN